MMKGLTKAYFEEFMCPRTGRGIGTEKFDYVLDLVRDFNVKGVMGYALSFCDPHKFDYPDLRDSLTQNEIPMLLIDDDYTLSNTESIRNRVEAFVEMLK
jgi:benzoyl-CoA reductase/2-hydroxyglutaryl-CoA dehydratase subunit BcrC/BadD/HgdB